jgi:Family of unknown function (DUF6283)
MEDVRQHACSACPYRRDVPSGIWVAEEYSKLTEYDAPTSEQPFGPFMCHAKTESYCHGWAVVHSNRGREYELIALRFAGCPTIPEPSVPLFDSGTEAANHGMADIGKPSEEAECAMTRLIKKYPRLELIEE